MAANCPKLTLDYTVDEGGWFIGNLRQIPGVISQGKTLDELKANILDALLLMLEDIAEESQANSSNQFPTGAKLQSVALQFQTL